MDARADIAAAGPAAVSRDDARAVFGQVMGLVAVTLGFLALGAYIGRDLGFFDAKSATVLAAVSVFAREMYQAPRSCTEQAYPHLIYFNEVDRGNNFAAWQEPELFTNEVRAGFRSLRERSSS